MALFNTNLTGDTIEIDGKKHYGDMILKERKLEYLVMATGNFNTNPLMESYNDELYIMNATSFRKWDGNKLTSLGTLPITLNTNWHANSVVYKNEIHLMVNPSSAGDGSHYKWNGKSWTSVTKNLPRGCINSTATVWNNEIHHMGGGTNTEWASMDKHYKWNGTSWTTVSTLPNSLYDMASTTYENAVHILGGYNNSSVQNKHYKWDGTSWTQVSTLPYSTRRAFAIVYENELRLIGGTNGTTNHYKWDGTSWTSVNTLPYELNHISNDVEVYKNYIHTVCGGGGGINILDVPMYITY